MQSSTSWYLHLLPLSYIQIINPHACHTDHPAHTAHSCISPLHFSFLGFSSCSPRSHCSLTRHILPISILTFSILLTLYTHSHTHTLTHSHTQTLKHSHTHTLTHSHTHTLTPSHTHTLTHSHIHTLTHSHTHTHKLTSITKRLNKASGHQSKITPPAK